jgi:hypothetical protein
MARAVFDAIRVAGPSLGPWHAFDACEVQRMADALKPFTAPPAAQPAPDTRHMPGWMKYDAATDVLIIHGRRYSAAMFGESGFLAQVGTLLRIEDGQPECVTLTTVQPAVPLTDWVSVDDRLPESGGYYLVTVDTDEGPHVDVLLYSVKEKHWLHEGEPTFCHSYFFSPTHWAARPEAARGITKGQP